MRVMASNLESYVEEGSHGEDIGILTSRMEQRREKWAKVEEDGTSNRCGAWLILY
jgi:RNA binding exosome subunit